MLQGCAHPLPSASHHCSQGHGFPALRWGTSEGWVCSIKELCMPWGGYGLWE